MPGPDVARLLGCVTTARPDSLILVPELLRLLVAAAERGWPAPSSLRFVAVGGASVAVELLERAAAVGLPVFEGYGLSECASVVCLNTPESRRPGSVGRPLPHARVRVGDGGQLMVSGVTMRGYLGDRRARRASEWATGDLGEIDADGYVYVRGRLGNMYITSFGRNVAPEWVEREIALEPGDPPRHGARRGAALRGRDRERVARRRRRARPSIARSGPRTRGCRTTRRCAAGRACPSPSPSRTGC